MDHAGQFSRNASVAARSVRDGSGRYCDSMLFNSLFLSGLSPVKDLLIRNSIYAVNSRRRRELRDRYIRQDRIH